MDAARYLSPRSSGNVGQPVEFLYEELVTITASMGPILWQDNILTRRYGLPSEAYSVGRYNQVGHPQ